jgi:hypothetical protein
VTAVWVILGAGWLFVAILGAYLVGNGIRIANEVRAASEKDQAEREVWSA